MSFMNTLKGKVEITTRPYSAAFTDLTPINNLATDYKQAPPSFLSTLSSITA